MSLKQIKIKSKKGTLFLESETMKMILAAICIIILVILAAKLYTLFMKKSAIEIARENLDQLVSKINLMANESENKFTLTGPNDWYLLLFNKGDPKPTQCKDAKSCLCICSKQNYAGCDQQGVCKGFDLESEMSYTCFTSSASGLLHVPKCFKVNISDIVLKKNNGIIFIGSDSGYSIGDSFFNALKIKDENGIFVEDLIFQVISNKDESTRLKIKKLIQAYLTADVSKISDWSIEVDLNGQIVTAFVEATPIDTSPGVVFIPTFSNSFEREVERDGRKYFFKFKFNLKN